MQQEWLVPQENEIPCEQLDKLLSLPPFAYILSGVRRSGKSTLLKQLMRQYGSLNYFNLENSLTAGFEVTDFLLVEELLLELSDNKRMFFFDEIQNVQGWERFVRDAVDRKQTVVITDQEDKFEKEGKTIRLIPGWKWMG